MEPKDYYQDCYFSLVNVKVSKDRKKITYPNLDSALRLVLHDLFMPAPLPPEDGFARLADEMVFDKDSSSATSNLTGSEYEPDEKLKLILFSPATIK